MFKKVIKCLCFILSFLVLIAALLILKLKFLVVDIRPNFIKDRQGLEQEAKAKKVLEAMQEAHGIQAWQSFKKASFTQEAMWYGRSYFSGWNEDPQLFEMNCHLGTNNGSLRLLSKDVESSYWSYENGQAFQDNRPITFNRLAEKIVYKNYWFQFPFRISEADFLDYVGEKQFRGETYHVLYATWGSYEANKDYDQFILYVNTKSNLLEYLEFTVREKMLGGAMTAEFRAFIKQDQVTLATSQFVRYGGLQEQGFKMHENHYKKISFDTR